MLRTQPSVQWQYKTKKYLLEASVESTLSGHKRNTPNGLLNNEGSDEALLRNPSFSELRPAVYGVQGSKLQKVQHEDFFFTVSSAPTPLVESIT